MRCVEFNLALGKVLVTVSKTPYKDFLSSSKILIFNARLTYCLIKSAYNRM